MLPLLLRVFLYVNIRGLRKGPGKFLMGVVDSPGFFLAVKEWEPWRLCCCYVMFWNLQLWWRDVVNGCRHVAAVCSEVDHERTSLVRHVICPADSVPALHAWTARLLARLPQISRGLDHVYRYTHRHLSV